MFRRTTTPRKQRVRGAIRVRSAEGLPASAESRRKLCEASLAGIERARRDPEAAAKALYRSRP